MQYVQNTCMCVMEVFEKIFIWPTVVLEKLSQV